MTGLEASTLLESTTWPLLVFLTSISSNPNMQLDQLSPDHINLMKLKFQFLCIIFLLIFCAGVSIGMIYQQRKQLSSIPQDQSTPQPTDNTKINNKSQSNPLTVGNATGSGNNQSLPPLGIDRSKVS